MGSAGRTTVAVVEPRRLLGFGGTRFLRYERAGVGVDTSRRHFGRPRRSSACDYLVPIGADAMPHDHRCIADCSCSSALDDHHALAGGRSYRCPLYALVFIDCPLYR